MRYVVCLFLSMLLSNLVSAQEADEFRLIQAQADVPKITVWANLPANTVIEKEQFKVSVGEHPAKVFDVEKFRKTGEGVGYIFLVDVSKNLRSRQLVQIKRTLHHWLDGMGRNDKAALITFGHESQHELEFTGDYFKLSNAIGMLAVKDMETSLAHGLIEAIGLGRSRRADLPDRRAIVVLSDGIDNGSVEASMDDVLRQTREYRIPIYSIAFVLEPINDLKREGVDRLAKLSEESGGYFIQADPNHLDRAYRKQQQRILGAYRLTLDCPDCKVSTALHRVDVTWSDGQRVLNDSLDMRLPARYALSRSHPRDSASTSEDGWRILVFGIGLLVFLVGLVWLYRNRLEAR